MAKKTWTDEQVKLLTDMYFNNANVQSMADALGKTVGSIKSKIDSLGINKQIIKKNNPKFKAAYQDYDWCYDRFINKGMNMHQMAEEAGATFRVIQKWCSEKYGLNEMTFRRHKKLSELQRELIMFGRLGDGHIDKRENEPMYIESHAENQKEYLFWKYDILKDLCNHEPAYYPPVIKYFNDKSYPCQASYRLNTRTIDCLIPIRDMSTRDIINRLNEFGLSLHILDDGYRSKSNWELCVGDWNQTDIEMYMNVCRDRFGLEVKQEKDIRYLSFTAESSRIIDKIILNNIPNDLDIIKYKIMKV